MTVLEKLASVAKIKRTAGRNAFYAGSTPLGIAVDNSDVDIMVPYKRKSSYLKAIERAKERYPELKENPSSASKLDKRVFTGKIGDKDVDLVYAHGEKAHNFAAAFRAAQKSLTPEKREQIRAKKARLKSSWFFPKTRYKRYKKRVADELGLKKHYF